MDLSGKTALVTGAGSGIGRQLSIQLAGQGCKITVVDWDKGGADETVAQIRRFSGTARAVKLDVCDDAAQQAVFQSHMDAYGQLDIAVLNAGVSEMGDVVTSEGSGWQKALDIDLRAVLVGARLAARIMTAQGRPGIILATASAAGFFPIPSAPVYSASKAGVVHFVRAISRPLMKRGIRVCALCPQYVDTPMVTATAGVRHVAQQMSGGAALLTVAQVVEAAMHLIEDESKVGTCLVVHMTGRWYEWAESKENMRLLRPAQGGAAKPQQATSSVLAKWASSSLPSAQKTVQVHRLSDNFREATRVVSLPLPTAIPPGHVLVRRAYAGVNASDINFTAGRYFGSPKEAAKRLPFESGFESVGAVAAVGPAVTELRVGDVVAQFSYNGFADYAIVPVKAALPVPACTPEIVALLTSGLTASIALEQVGRMRSGETVLVTAAAGGTGQFAVQLAKAAGNYVIATCSSQAKVDLLKRLGADRVINYKQEVLKEVLKREYPKGVDLIFESVGGDVFKTCTQALATQGRLVIIGMMSQYGGGWTPLEHKGLPELLLWKAASLSGFFLPQWLRDMRTMRRHLATLTTALLQGRLHVAIDPTPFRGVESVAAAVDHLQSGNSVGKVYVQLADDVPSQATARL
ncbi:hypothetical protein WJX72_002127 [[Myrmecia] bisecta]|uniref:Enoyl reductase (ER) domain-containing protein n=1 Tax=[Myrmecia] bisecta TaxID=41462 RepID=A0AAW1PWZ8_9CHLO